MTDFLTIQIVGRPLCGSHPDIRNIGGRLPNGSPSGESPASALHESDDGVFERVGAAAA